MATEQMPSGDGQSSPPSGFIEHAVRSWRIWRTEHHYRSILHAEIQERLHQTVDPGRVGVADNGNSGVLSGMAHSGAMILTPASTA